MKKKVSLATLCCIGLSALIAIFALFGILKIKGIVADLLFTALTLTVAGVLTLNSCDMLEKKNKIALISLALIGLSSLFVILCFWTNLDSFNAYMNITLVISTLSVCFNLISSSILKLEKNYKLIQIISYSCYSVVSLYLILIFLKAIDLDGTHLKIFILFIILSLVGLFVLKVLSKKSITSTQDNVEYIKITKEEYLDLLSKKEELEKLLTERAKND